MFLLLSWPITLVADQTKQAERSSQWSSKMFLRRFANVVKTILLTRQPFNATATNTFLLLVIYC